MAQRKVLVYLGEEAPIGMLELKVKVKRYRNSTLNTVQLYASIQVWKYTGIRICKYVSEYTSM